MPQLTGCMYLLTKLTKCVGIGFVKLLFLYVQQ